METQPQDYDDFNFSEDKPTEEIYVDVENVVNDVTKFRGVDFENIVESGKHRTSLENAGRLEAAKVGDLKKKEDLEVKKQKDEQSHGQQMFDVMEKQEQANNIVSDKQADKKDLL